ncbi:MAG: 50S ribosomal protein L21 [Chloroflexota bacterium]
MNDYAVIKTGGKQYQVHEGDTLDVEKLPGEKGDPIELTDVLMVSRAGNVTVGTPTVPGARVSAQIVEHGRAAKIVIFKYKRKVRYRRRTGHRQSFTRLSIRSIEG